MAAEAIPPFVEFILKPYILIPIILWSTIWKGIALWKSVKNRQLVWFIFILIMNTVGILEIIYLAFFQKKK